MVHHKRTDVGVDVSAEVAVVRGGHSAEAHKHILQSTQLNFLESLKLQKPVGSVRFKKDITKNT